MFLKLTIKLAQGLLNTKPLLFIAARDSKRILKGQGGIERSAYYVVILYFIS